jgi:phosphate starvation-inducible PhoH-like protein
MPRRKSINHLTDEELQEELMQWEEDRRNQTLKSSMTSSINIKCRSRSQREVIKAIENHDISIIIGPPGTGKTYLSCARALKYVKSDPGKYKRIVLIKSVNVPKDEEIGYLKGSLEEKMELYVYPFISNFEKVIGKMAVQSLRSSGTIEILPIKFALGVTLDDAIVIVDEAQQISKDNLRTLITRIGPNSKMIFLGDIKQKSVNKNRKSALEILIEHFTDIPEVGMVELTQDDVVRHPIIKKIIKVFDKIDQLEGLNGIR